MEKPKKETAVDGEIIELMEKKDERALMLLHKQYGRYMQTIAFDILGSHADSEECVNDVFLSLWKSVANDRPRCFIAYITRCVRNAALNRRKENNRLKRAASEHAISVDDLFETLTSNETPGDMLDSILLRDILNGFVGSLDKKRRYIFISRYNLGTPIKRIARELGVSDSTVFYDLSIMKKQLRELLEKEGYHA